MMGQRGGRVLSLAVAAGFVIISGCGSGDSADCLSNDVGKICADNSNGSIKFSGRGLAPESEVLIDNPDLGTSVYQAGTDGTFEPGGRGVLSFITGTPFTFTISATDAEGQPLDGEIVITP